MADEKIIQHPVTGKFTWYAKCGASHSGYSTKSEAEVALRLHKVGCKVC